MPKLVLFDIDGTLIDSGGAGSRACNLAMEELTGIRDGLSGVDFAGKTDLQIVREGFSNHGLSMDDGLMERFMDAYPGHLKAVMRTTSGTVKPGVKQLLEGLEARNGAFVGLLTGNVESGARLKLEPHRLNRYFPFGAFGCDHEDRNRLLPIAVRRLTERACIDIAYTDCVVIGDTPRDVECAVVHGSVSIAVATGPHDVETLKRTGADLVVTDLSRREGIIEWVMGR